MRFWEFKEIVRLCYTPISIISPVPLFALFLFILSNKYSNLFSESYLLFIGILVTLLSSFGSNLWNHCNDLKEDFAQGKKTVLTQNSYARKVAILISILLYLISTLIVSYVSLVSSRPIYVYFLIWVVITWWYSDNLFFKKIFGFRLKNHYVGELITYGIAWPMYTMSIWLLYSDFNSTGILISLAFLFFGMYGVLLKDLKDISGDRRAGLKTLGVIFSPSELIRMSCLFVTLYYLVMIETITSNIFSIAGILTIIPFVYFIKNCFLCFYKKGWKLQAKDAKVIKNMTTSTCASIVIFGFGKLF